MYRIVFQSGRMKGRRLVIQEGAVTIGTDPGCDITPTSDPAVGRKHAQLEERDDGVHLLQLDPSLELTLGKKSVEQAVLHHGDEFQLGETRILFQEIHPIHRESERRTGTLQKLTIGAVALLVVLEVGFLIGFSFFKDDHIEEIVAEAKALEEAERKKEEAKAKELAKEGERITALGEMAYLNQTHKEQAEAAAEKPVQPAVPVPVPEPEPEPETEPEPPTEMVKAEEISEPEAESEPEEAPTLPVFVFIDRVAETQAQSDDETWGIRTLMIRIKPAKDAASLDPARVRVQVAFYEKDEDGAVVPAKGLVPQESIYLPEHWTRGEPVELHASYVTERVEDARAASYYGYAVQVYYGHDLQDEMRKPPDAS